MTKAKSEIPTGAVLGEWRRGWPVVSAAALGYGTGAGMLMMTSGLFIAPMREDLGWSTTAVTIAPIISLVWAASSPGVGVLVDRFGPRRIAIIGALVLAACFVLLAKAPISQFTLYAVAVVIGIIGPMTNVAPYAKGVGSWFRYSVGTALGITMTGASLVAVFSVPAVSAAIYNFDWRAGYLTLAAFVLFIGLPMIIALFRVAPAGTARPIEATGSPSATDAPSGLSFRDATRDARFWAFAGVAGLGSIPIGGFLAHLQPLLANREFGLAEAASLGVLYAIATSIGRIGGGVLLDRFWDCAVAALLLVIASVGAISLGVIDVDTPTLIVMTVVFLVGMGHGAETDFIAYFMLRTFGMRAYSTIVGTAAMASSLGMALGAFCFAALFDAMGNYFIACLLGAGGFLVSAILILSVGISERREQR